jgi:hypothetical protein
MILGLPAYGVVDGERPPLLHRLGTLANRSCCGKPIEVLPQGAERSHRVQCTRCNALDAIRRSQDPDDAESRLWF